MSVASAGTALAMLADLAGSGAEVALLVADERLVEMPAVDFLARAHDLHPGAKRVLLIQRGDWSSAHPAVCAMALGQIDYYLYAPWLPERILYPAVSEFLAAWDKSREPSFAVFHIVGPPGSPGSHRLRDVLSRTGVPYRFFDDGSEKAGNCCGRTIWRASARPWPSAATAPCSSIPREQTSWGSWASGRAWMCMPAMSSSSAPGLPVSRPRSTRRRRASARWSSSRPCPEARPVRAP